MPNNIGNVPEAIHMLDAWPGLYASGAIPTQLRKADADTQLQFITKNWIAPFSYMISKNWNGKKSYVEDRKFETYEIEEPDRFLLVTKDATSGVNGVDGLYTIGMSNDHATLIKPYNTLYVQGLFATPTIRTLYAGQVLPVSGSNVGTSIGPDLGWVTGNDVTKVNFSRAKGVDANGTYFTKEEQMLVVEVGAADSAGFGHTKVTVKRCCMGAGARDEGGKNIPANIIATSIAGNQAGANYGTQNDCLLVAGDRLWVGMPAYWEGTGYPDGSFRTPRCDVNFTQLYKYAVSRTKESKIPKTILNKDAMDINRWLTLILINYQKERTYLLGRKGMERDAQGREFYTCGGVREFIPEDSDHYIVFPHASLTYSNLLYLASPLYNLCNSGKMTAITGTSTDIALRKVFADSPILRINKEESNGFQIEVKTLKIGEMELDLIVSQVMEEMGYGKELMCLDMNNGNSFEPVTHKGWDYIVEKDLADKGINQEKEGVQGMIGLRRRRSQHHCIINLEKAI
jgi:hypothetical protein